MMRRVSSAALFFFVVAVAAVAPAAAADPRAWPTAYEPVTMSARDVLAAARAAQGTDTGGTLRAVYDVRDGGLQGTEREIRRGDDYRSDVTVGPFVTAQGTYHGDHWELTDNGYTLLKRDGQGRGEANARALGAPSGADVRVLGRLRAPADVIAVRVAPPRGRDERRFYDAATFRLVRREIAYPAQLVVMTYDDFRTVRGRTVAFHTTYGDGMPENDSSSTIRSFDPGAAVSDAELAIPPGRRAPVTFPPGTAPVRLPARIDRFGAIIVTVDINGRGLDFQLDSGSSSMVIDRAVAAELGLPVYGRWSETVAGTFARSKTIVPRMQIGAITMTDVVVDALPFMWDTGDHAKVVGLLGFDFLAGGVFKIDYQHGTVDAMRYDAPLPADATVTDAVLDDGVPLIAIGVNGVKADRFIVDTGAWDVLVFSRFAAAHPGLIKDHTAARNISLRSLHPYRSIDMESEGVGGALHARGLVLEQLQIGRVGFTDFFAEVLQGDQPAFEGENADGLIGASVLSAFDVYLDYANSRVAFALNESGKRKHPARGFGVGR